MKKRFFFLLKIAIVIFLFTCFFYTLSWANTPSLTMQEDTNFWARYKILFVDTAYLLLPCSAIIGILYVSPSSVSQWDHKEKDITLWQAGEKWFDHVSHSPILDNDRWWLNYIGHPYWGAAYYIHARKLGFSDKESLLYAFCASTFFYEYGVEAIFERPSVQDIIVTPMGGWILGHYVFIPLSQKIEANEEKVWGQKWLGKTLLVLLDPIGHVLKPLKDFKKKWRGEVSFFPIWAFDYKKSNFLGIHIQWNFF